MVEVPGSIPGVPTNISQASRTDVPESASVARIRACDSRDARKPQAFNYLKFNLHLYAIQLHNRLMKRILIRLGQAYVSLAIAQFIIGICVGVWMVYNGQQPLDLLNR